MNKEKLNKNQKKIVQKAEEYLTLYKAGFQDGYNCAKKKNINWKKLFPLAIASWRIRTTAPLENETTKYKQEVKK